MGILIIRRGKKFTNKMVPPAFLSPVLSLFLKVYEKKIVSWGKFQTKKELADADKLKTSQRKKPVTQQTRECLKICTGWNAGMAVQQSGMADIWY